jgi:signal transduction histidine kinase
VELVPARPQRWLVWLIIASLIVPLAFVGLIAHQARRAALEAADQHISGTVMLLREHAQKVLDTDDLVIQQVDRLTAGMSWDDIAHSEALHRQLKQLDDGLPQMRGIYVIAPNGTIVGSSRSFPAAPSNATNRDFFSAIRNGYPGTFISRPYTEPTTGNQQFSVARRRSSPDGAFDGVIVAADSATYFEAAYQYIGEEAAAVVLARSDGEELASYPTPMFAGSRIPADLVTQTSEKSPLIVRSIPAPYDGTDRLGGYQRLHGYPLLVGYSISASSVTAAWLRMVILNGVLVLLGSLAVAVIGWLALRGFRREEAAYAAYRAEAELRERAESIAENAKRMEAIGQLAAGVAHDFNNLLAIVSGNLESLLNNATTEQERRLDVALSATMRGSNLVRQLLTFARREVFEPEIFEINEALRELSPLLGSLLTKHISLECHLTSSPLPCRIDRAEFEFAILNIATNARHAMPNGGSFEVDSESIHVARNPDGLDLPSGAYVRIALVDNGVGMPPEILARVFEPLFTTRKPGEGTGLGLSQVYGFAQQSGGLATIESAVGRGTTVAIYLPVAQTVAAATREPAVCQGTTCSVQTGDG